MENKSLLEINVTLSKQLLPIFESIQQSHTDLIANLVDLYSDHIVEIYTEYLKTNNEALLQMQEVVQSFIQSNPIYSDKYKELTDTMKIASTLKFSNEEIIRQTEKINPMNYTAIKSDEALQSAILELKSQDNIKSNQQEQASQIEDPATENETSKQIDHSQILMTFILSFVLPDLYTRIVDKGLDIITSDQATEIIEQLISFLKEIFNLS